MFYNSIKEFPAITYSCYGGTKDAERFCIAFDGRNFVSHFQQNTIEDVSSFPIVCICISPSNIKYSETLTHRDYLGALLHLGITRNKIGDIYIKDKKAYVFCI